MNPEPAHFEFRQKPFGAETRFDLEHDLLRARRANKEIVIPLKDIVLIRLYFAPGGVNIHGYKATILGRNREKLVLLDRSWRSLMEQVQLGPEYRAFIVPLCAAVEKANPKVVLFAGKSILRHWGTALFGLAVTLGLLTLTGRAVFGGFYPLGLALGAFTALFGAWSWRYVIRNRPRAFRADAIPDDIIPPS